jgi:hypothetical protein
VIGVTWKVYYIQSLLQAFTASLISRIRKRLISVLVRDMFRERGGVERGFGKHSATSSICGTRSRWLSCSPGIAAART